LRELFVYVCFGRYGNLPIRCGSVQETHAQKWISYSAVSTPVTLGDGRKAKFWLSARWHGQRLQDIAPTVFKAPRKKNRSVQAALQK